MSDDFTVGVEEEFCIVDATTGELRPVADQVLPLARETLGDQVEAELNRAQIETGTAVCTTLAEVRAELDRLRRLVREAAGRAGCSVISAGTDPLAGPEESGVNPGKERYRRLEQEFHAALVAALQEVEASPTPHSCTGTSGPRPGTTPWSSGPPTPASPWTTR